MSEKSTEVTTGEGYNEQELDCVTSMLVYKKIPESFFAEETQQLIDIEEREAKGETVDPEETKKIKQVIQQKKDWVHNEINKHKRAFTEIIGKNELESLVKNTNCRLLSDYLDIELQPTNPMERILADQCVASHKLAMVMLNQIYEKSGQLPIDKMQRLTNMFVRVMNASQQSAQIIHKMRNNSTQTMVIKHQHVHVNDGGQAMVADDFVQVGGGRDETKK